jgi:hypothetical protein
MLLISWLLGDVEGSKMGLHGVGGVGGSGFFGEEMGKMRRETGSKGPGTKGLGSETARVGDWLAVICGPGLMLFLFCSAGGILSAKFWGKVCPGSGVREKGPWLKPGALLGGFTVPHLTVSGALPVQAPPSAWRP